MNEQSCPNCGQITNSSSSRMIEDSCGHMKCRLCLLQEEQGCKSCKNKCASELPDEMVFAASTSSQDCTENVPKISVEKKPEVKPKDKKQDLKPVTTKKMDRSHIITLPGTPEQYQCTKCEKIFKNKKSQCYHDVCITGIKPYNCTMCDRSFVKKSHYEYHERMHTGLRPFKCSCCDKAFPQRNKLNRHMLSHNQEKQFPCPECGKRYAKKDDLKIHMMLHTGKLPHVCKSCGRGFRIRSNLNRHMLSHSSARPHVCDFCGKSFKEKSLLARHTRTHGKDRPYCCDDCSRVFLSKSELRRHIAIHSETKPFSCTFCQTNFRRKDNLNRHIRHHHSADTLKKVKATKSEERPKKSSIKTKAKPKAVSRVDRKKSSRASSPLRPKTSEDLGQKNHPINPRIDSMGNVTPVIRVPGELSNAVPVINGPIHVTRPSIDSEAKKKIRTYTQPIPRAEAVVINQRIEEMLYQQSIPTNPCFFPHHSNRSDLAMPPLVPLRYNPVKPVAVLAEKRVSNSSYLPPKNSTLTELRSITVLSNETNDNEDIVNTKDDKKINSCGKSDADNCVSTIKKNIIDISTQNNNNNSCSNNNSKKGSDIHWRRRTAETLKPFLHEK